ncbi:Cytochrome c-type protein NapC [hydrothermal vent metagenome]|uniref:Cytochrome c-type protein NapC n=1 Tax=hydrothermal vent metagenome TaxID=652676 RepID=A0A3B0VRE4_9ZZZZ
MTGRANKQESRLKKIWNKPKRRWLLGIPAGGFVMFFAGIIFWGGFNTAMEATNTMTFCTGCHEMSDKPYTEYKESVHYKNTAGVRATCSDCHVPKSWGAKLLRKIYATNELYHSILGTIDTPEKFEANRLAMAQRVWATMRSNNSRECRNCHHYEYMDLAKQDRSAKKKHDPKRLAKSGKTCIDCHQGIAHKLPDDY